MKKIEFEKSIQLKFLNQITSKKSTSIYKDLIYYRFNETLSNIFIESKKFFSEQEWRESIFKFIQSGSKTAIMWQMPKEFKDFLIKNKIAKGALKDLLWFEWIEVEIYMAKEDFKNQKFSWNQKFKLSNKAKIKNLKYPIYRDDFKSRGEYKLLIYENRKKYEILWLEITNFMYDFLKSLNKKEKIIDILKRISKKNNLNYIEVKELLKDILKDFVKNGILVRADYAKIEQLSNSKNNF